LARRRVKSRESREAERLLRSRNVPTIGKFKPTTVVFSMSMYRYPHPRTMNLVQRMLNQLQGRRPDIDIIMGQQLATALIVARQAQFQLVLDHKADFLVISDDDMNWAQDDTFNALERMISLDKDIVSACCFSRHMPIVCFVSIEESGEHLQDPDIVLKGEPFKAKYTGFGLILIKRHVVEKVAEYSGGVENIPNFIGNWREHPEALERLSAASSPEEIMDAVDYLQRRAKWFYEDYSFCRKARECGFDIWIDPSFECAHIGDYDYGVKDWAWMLRKQKENADARSSA
jgi:hypothetical protein